MSIVNLGKRIFTHFCQQGIADRANFLKNVAVAGWALSSLAQTCAIIFNDKIPSKEKKFLIPQEIIDGIANVTLFWFISSKATDFGKKLILNKRILPKSIAKLTENFKVPKGSISEMKSAFIKHIKKVGTSFDVKTADDAIEGMGVLTGIVGAILSNNICTPLIRNKLASVVQKKELIKERHVNLNPNYGNLDYKKYKFDNLTAPSKTVTFKGLYNNPSIKI
ncbi:MAG: hypothetical protein MJ180_01045 [Candidatus Gastranaerophilales bacterium]|nr:hypothetical protein [Candidatus Gastranaerophilales bacterium]